MTGRHSKCGAHARIPAPRRSGIELVDITGTAHLVTADAADNGLRRGRYTTMCGEDVLPAALVARQSRYCRLCVPIPPQRSR